YLEQLYGIPRHPRFLHLDGDGDGPERQARGARVGDPRSFFDMSRPDLSQPRTSSAILLTEELRVPEARPLPSAQRSAPGGPAKTPPVLREHPPKSASKAPGGRGAPAQVARRPLNTPPTMPPATASWPRAPLDAAPPVVPQALKSAASAKPPPVAIKQPEVLHPHVDAGEASSRAPTVPGLPSFLDTDVFASGDSPAGSPTVIIDPS